MDNRWPLQVLVVALLGAVAAPSARADNCDDMSLVAEARQDDGAPQPVEFVVPCALLDSGALGPDCQEAPFYVVTHQGTALCRVDHFAFASGPSAPHVERAPAGVPPPSGAGIAALVPALLGLPPPPLASAVARALLVGGPGPADAHERERLRPS